MVSRRVLSFKPATSITSVSPSHLPTEFPNQVGSRFLGWSRPSVGMERKICHDSYRITTRLGAWTIWTGSGALACRVTPTGRQGSWVPSNFLNCSWPQGVSAAVVPRVRSAVYGPCHVPVKSLPDWPRAAKDTAPKHARIAALRIILILALPVFKYAETVDARKT